jgi:hypothetical protein
MSENIKVEILDLTKFSNGKWLEVGYFNSCDILETPKIIAKFLLKYEAIKFAEYVSESYAGITQVIIR